MKMNCEDAGLAMSRALDGELSAPEDAMLHEHLRQCADCRAAWERDRKLMDMLTSLPDAAPPADYADRLREAVRGRAEGQPPPVLLPGFRVLAVAAVATLSVVTVLLALSLHRTRGALQAARTDRPAPRTATLPHFNLNGGLAEELVAFGHAQDYLQGAMRWMAMDGEQIEVGMSATPVKPAPATAQTQKVIVLVFEYTERTDKSATRLSRPQFVMLPGEEASVRLQPSEATSDERYRYRVKADMDTAGHIHASIHFALESMNGKGVLPQIQPTFGAQVLLEDRKPVLIGATATGDTRRELYVWATSRQLSVSAQGDDASSSSL